MMSFSTAAIALAVAATPATPVTSTAPQAVTYPAELPADCITSGSSVITQGQAVRMPGGDVASLEGRSACDSHGNMAIITGGVLGPITSYLAPPPVPATVAPVTQVEASAGEGGDIAGIIIGCTIFGGFLSLFAGGVFLAVRHSYRVNPDPSVKWAGPPLMLAGAGGPPSVRDQLEGMYQGSLDGVNRSSSPEFTGKVHPSSPGTGYSEVHSSSPVHQPIEWEDDDSRVDLTGMSAQQFKEQFSAGSFKTERLFDEEYRDWAAAKVFDYLVQFERRNLEFIVWWTFGQHKTGKGTAGESYAIAKDFVKGITQDWATGKPPKGHPERPIDPRDIF